MIVKFADNQMKKICTNASVAIKKYGIQMATIIAQRISELEAADTIDQLMSFHVGKCHRLKGDRATQYAINLIQPYRLIFTKESEQPDIVKLIEIVDYH